MCMANDSMAHTTTYQYQGCAVASEGQYVRRFRLILRSGKVYNLSYSLIPNIILTEDHRLIIRTLEDLYIEITGRNLGALEEYFAQEVVKWVRESPSNIDDGEAYIFISTIQVNGPAIHAGPPEKRDTDQMTIQFNNHKERNGQD